MMNGKNSNDDIQQGINNSHLFICFVSKAYCKSKSLNTFIGNNFFAKI